jgi:hypothetical protein
MKPRMRDRFPVEAAIFSHCVGFLDGTLLPFKHSPGFPSKDQNADFFSYQKGQYGLQCTLVCDDQRKILVASSRWPGSVNDARALTSLKMYREPKMYFEAEAPEYVLADSAYPPSNRLVSPFTKRGRGPRRLYPKRKQFNQMLSTLRVPIEHCIGRQLELTFQPLERED